jgi:hypothetical protein
LATVESTALTTLAHLGTRRTHLVQLFHLVGRQDLRQLGLRISFQGRELLLLISRQFQLLPGLRGQQVKAAARSIRPAGLAVGGRRLLAISRRRAILGVYDIGRGTERQGQDEEFRFHNM